MLVHFQSVKTHQKYPSLSSNISKQHSNPIRMEDWEHRCRSRIQGTYPEPQQKSIGGEIFATPHCEEYIHRSDIFCKKARSTNFLHSWNINNSTCPLQKDQFNKKYHLPTMEFSGDGENTTQKKPTPLNNELDLNTFQQNPKIRKKSPHDWSIVPKFWHNIHRQSLGWQWLRWVGVQFFTLPPFSDHESSKLYNFIFFRKPNNFVWKFTGVGLCALFCSIKWGALHNGCAHPNCWFLKEKF